MSKVTCMTHIFGCQPDRNIRNIDSMANPCRLTVFSLLLAITGSAFTQATSGNIIGDGNPGDTVVISGDSNGFKRELAIRSDGKYKLRHVPIGSYHVTFIQADGKIITLQDVQVRPDATSRASTPGKATEVSENTGNP